jgi:hypothetical protein
MQPSQPMFVGVRRATISCFPKNMALISCFFLWCVFCACVFVVVLKKQHSSVPPSKIMVSQLQLLLLTALLCQFAAVSSTCSRLLSRRVRKFIQSDVFPRLPIAPQDLPMQCQLNPIHDIYFDQEQVIQQIKM